MVDDDLSTHRVPRHSPSFLKNLGKSHKISVRVLMLGVPIPGESLRRDSICPSLEKKDHYSGGDVVA
ncbi:hypothetical protein TNCV_1224961 [Trichonephila clavipes]|nr:hypothetical protein TNCV_1224961 [Trichonephila clavipes]